MNWTVPTLLDDALSAWSGDNWPYTLAFWVAVVVAIYLVDRRVRGKDKN